MKSPPLLTALLSAALAAFTGHANAAPKEGYVIGRTGIDAPLPNGDKLQIELWYPAASPEGGSPDFLFTEALKAALAKYTGMPKMAISTKEKGKGRRGVDPAQGAWPLVVFSHGFASFSRQNNRQAEALARAGYVVAALSHPGESLTTEYANGEIKQIDDDHPAMQYMGERAKKSDLRELAAAMNAHLGPVANADSAEGYRQAMHELNANTLFGTYQTNAERRAQQLAQWVRSLFAVKDQSSPVLKQLDLKRIALYGHSLGGVVSVAAAQLLSDQGIEIKAVVNLDAPQFYMPDPDDRSLASPTCFLMGGATKAGKTKLVGTGLNTLWAKSSDEVCEINIEKAAHNNFTDLSWVTVLKWFGQLGPVANKKFGVWLNGFLIAYFDHHLKGKAFNYPVWPDAQVVGNIAKREAVN